MIIWGTRTMKKILGLTNAFQCYNCNNAGQFHIVRLARWFTLFWIPIFPFSMKYFIACPVCDVGKELPKEQALQSVIQQIQR